MSSSRRLQDYIIPCISVLKRAPSAPTFNAPRPTSCAQEWSVKRLGGHKSLAQPVNDNLHTVYFCAFRRTNACAQNVSKQRGCFASLRKPRHRASGLVKRWTRVPWFAKRSGATMPLQTACRASSLLGRIHGILWNRSLSGGTGAACALGIETVPKEEDS